jgi:predicted MFS family arabinose efflux permease
MKTNKATGLIFTAWGVALGAAMAGIVYQQSGADMGVFWPVLLLFAAIVAGVTAARLYGKKQ